MNELIKRMEFIEDKCNEEKREARLKKEQEMKNLDDFARAKKKISEELKEVRKEIEERNQLLGKSGSNTATVKMSSSIRNKLKQLLAETEALKGMYEKQKAKLDKKKAKGKKYDENEEKELEVRAEIVELCFKHIEECRHLERMGTGIGNDFIDAPKGPVVSKLPDIPDDEGFALLQKNDQIIEGKLVVVGEGVQVLKQMAIEMGREVEQQGEMLTELEKNMDQAQATLDNLNKRLKKTLSEVRSADRFCIDFILLVVVLAIAAYIYNLVRKK